MLKAMLEIKINCYESSKNETFYLVEMDQEVYWSWMVLFKNLSIHLERIYKWVS